MPTRKLFKKAVGGGDEGYWSVSDCACVCCYIVAGGEVRTVADSRQLQLLEEFEKRKRVSGGAGEGRCLAVTSGVPTAGQSHCCAHR
jgi:hypothetical protein